jgi:methyl-accepting chemotaxis protein
MTASINEIARSAGEASRVAEEGVQLAHSTTETVAQLSQSSNEIDEVVKLITSIAAQTNLLALNATIEAARAGEAGKGFAIVAGEVKSLAMQTAEATDQISKKVQAIQADSTGAITAMTKIDHIMGRIDAAQASIATAVEQQTATTGEIGRTVHDAAAGSGEIARNIAHVANAAQDTTAGASETLRSAEDLSAMACELSALVAAYKF